MNRVRSAGMHGLIVCVVASVRLVFDSQEVIGQVIVTGIPSFEARGARSIENEILSRLAASGLYQPDDLPRLARLTVLESIAMVAGVRADLPDTSIGSRLEGGNRSRYGMLRKDST